MLLALSPVETLGPSFPEDLQTQLQEGRVSVNHYATV